MVVLSPPAAEEHALRVLLDRIVPAFLPQAVYLFGSRAEGQARKDSDWDLLVVVSDDTPLERLTVVAGYEAIRGSGVAADVIPTRRSRFEALKDQVGSLSYVAPVGDGLSTQSNLARRWLDTARRDLLAARNCVDGPHFLPGIAAYHCQQAEKSW